MVQSFHAHLIEMGKNACLLMYHMYIFPFPIFNATQPRRADAQSLMPFYTRFDELFTFVVGGGKTC